ncbi:MAG TPA: serine/threonine-protein kinase [Pirellulales bacterium]|jgi:serine/threonine-protein kinase|nr:serine/threonine-protein kinase [Pirellulales bacterium]
MSRSHSKVEPTAATPNAARDERLAALLSELPSGAGSAAEVERLAAEHPDLADELRELWQAMLLVDRLADAAFAEDQTATLFGDYELLEELGRGGMGVVYRARHRGLEREVALKRVRFGSAAPADELSRFRHEALAAARLSHPHVVPVYEVGEYDGQPYFTMQYIAGTTLARRLADGPLPPREVAELLLPVCEAIHAAHCQGVLHRDLKPSNILIDESGRPLVADFGLAKRVEQDSTLTHSGAVLGTPTYMAPEQAAGSRGQVGPASDVYSLGTILYQMLTGRPPFQGATAMETVLMVLEQEPLPPRLLNPHADRALEMIALKCLQKPPDLRYSSAQALADDLRAYLADEPIAARSGQFAQIWARWMGETHHATVLESWGLLWMWHSLVLLVLCLVTNAMQWRGVTSRWPYAALWVAGLGTWAAIFWALRRRAGPVTFVERQIAHVWAGSMASIALLFPVEWLLGEPVLRLSPVLGLISGCVFLVKAGMLSGAFYVQAIALFTTALVMAWFERTNLPWGISLFGIVAAASFFIPGLKYYRQREITDRAPP